MRDMTLWQVVLLVDITIKILENGWNGPRSDLCDSILAEFRQRWEQSGCHDAMEKVESPNAWLKASLERRGLTGFAFIQKSE